TLFTLPLPIRSYFSMYPTGDITEHLPELIPFMPVALLLCSLSLIVFVWGYYSRFADRTAEHLWRPRTGDRYYLASIIIIGISFSLISLLAGNDILKFILLGYSSSAETFGRGYLAVGFPWLFVGILFLLCRYSAHRKRVDLFLFFTALLILTAIELIMGNRGRVVYMILTVLIYFHHAIHPIGFKRVMVVGLGTFISLN